MLSKSSHQKNDNDWINRLINLLKINWNNKSEIKFLNKSDKI